MQLKRTKICCLSLLNHNFFCSWNFANLRWSLLKCCLYNFSFDIINSYITFFSSSSSLSVNCKIKLCQILHIFRIGRAIIIMCVFSRTCFHIRRNAQSSKQPGAPIPTLPSTYSAHDFHNPYHASSYTGGE